MARSSYHTQPVVEAIKLFQVLRFTIEYLYYLLTGRHFLYIAIDAAQHILLARKISAAFTAREAHIKRNYHIAYNRDNGETPIENKQERHQYPQSG